MTYWKLIWKYISFFCKNNIDFNLIFCKDKFQVSWKHLHMDFVFHKNEIQFFFFFFFSILSF